MKTFVAEIIPEILKYSQKLDNLSLLTNQPWVKFNDEPIKTVWIFQDNNNLLIVKNGIVEKGRWEYVDNNTLLIEMTNTRLLLKHGFFDNYILALKLDSQNEFAFFINESKCDYEFNSISNIISFLESRYLNIKYSHIETFNKYFEKKKRKYKSPGYTVLKKYNSFSLLGGKFEVIKIKYADGQIGSIYKKRKSGHSFFKSGQYIGSRYCTYRDFDSCVNGFHYYLTKKGILKKIYLNSFLKRLLLTSGHTAKVSYWYPNILKGRKLINI